MEKGKLKVCWTFIHNKKLKVSCVLHALPQFLCTFARFDLDSILQTGVCASRSSRTLSMLDCSHSTRHRFAAVNCSDAVMSVFYAPVLTCSQIFLQLWTAVS